MRDVPSLPVRSSARPASPVPPVRDPWAEDGDELRAAKGITLGTVLSLGVWTLVAIVALLVLAVLA
jgi:hypothetical protein